MHRRHALAMLAAPLALAALRAVLEAAPASPVVDMPPAAADPDAPSVLDTPPGWSEPSPLVSAIIGAQLKNIMQFIREAGDDLSGFDEARARMEARGGAIYDELVAGRGLEAHAAWRDALERVDYGLRLICAHLGIDLDGSAGAA